MNRRSEVGEIHETRAEQPEQPSARERRRLALASVARALAVATAITIGYFVLPLTPHFAGGFVALAGGLGLVAVLLAWQILAIVRSPYPGLQALTTLALITPLFLVAFSATYYIMSASDSSAFSEPLTRLDAAYFAVTAFATVGFGDIVATSEVARAVITMQMLAGLVLVGVIARVIVGAVQEGRSRQRGHGHDD